MPQLQASYMERELQRLHEITERGQAELSSLRAKLSTLEAERAAAANAHPSPHSLTEEDIESEGDEESEAELAARHIASMCS